MDEDEKWMKIAIKEAYKAEKLGEIPVGAILVKDNILISKGHNQSILNNDPTAHAEIQVLRYAGIKEKNYRLVGTTLYVTLEPCAMCLGAMMHARIERIVFGASDTKSGVCSSHSNLTKSTFFNHKILVNGGIMKEDCKKILQVFFKKRRC